MANGPREKDDDTRRKEFDAMNTLRKRYRMRDAKAGTWDALCPAHEDRNRSLRVYRFDDRYYFHCYAGCHFNDVRRALGLQAFGNGLGRPRVDRKPAELPTVKPGAPDFAALAERFAAPREVLRHLSLTLGVSVESLADAGVGYCDGFPMWSNRAGRAVPVTAWVWPMTNHTGGSVLGLRMRAARPDADGRYAKFSWTGSTPGLFAGTRWHGNGPIAVCEGPTERAAAWDMGFDVFGRPSANDGDEMVEAMLDGLARASGKRRPVLVLGQSDAAKVRPHDGAIFYPGQEGALALADRLARRNSVRVIFPPNGYKDYREWRKATGATWDAVLRAAENRQFHKPPRR